MKCVGSEKRGTYKVRHYVVKIAVEEQTYDSLNGEGKGDPEDVFILNELPIRKYCDEAQANDFVIFIKNLYEAWKLAHPPKYYEWREDIPIASDSLRSPGQDRGTAPDPERSGEANPDSSFKHNSGMDENGFS